MSRRPLIGVSGWLERARWLVFDLPLAFVEARFVEKLDEAGADSVILPVQSRVPLALLAVLDGIVLTGGHDVGAGRYGAPGPAEPQPEREARDAAELELARIGLDRDIPMLAICRGCQVLNVAAGGTLVGHVPERYAGVVHTRYEEGREPFEFAEHEVCAVPGTPIEAILGARFDVLSSHHQAVDRLGDGLEPAAWSDDGVLEAVYAPAKAFAVGVQWHPEAEQDSTLFDGFVDAARRRPDASGALSA